MGESRRLGYSKKRAMKALLAAPERTWTVPTLTVRGGKEDAVRQLVAHLRLLGALDEVEAPRRYRFRFRQGVLTAQIPGVYRLSKTGPECLRQLLNDARPTGVVALLFTEGWSPAMAALRLRGQNWSPTVIAWRIRDRRRR